MPEIEENDTQDEDGTTVENFRDIVTGSLYNAAMLTPVSSLLAVGTLIKIMGSDASAYDKTAAASSFMVQYSGIQKGYKIYEFLIKHLDEPSYLEIIKDIGVAFMNGIQEGYKQNVNVDSVEITNLPDSMSSFEALIGELTELQVQRQWMRDTLERETNGDRTGLLGRAVVNNYAQIQHIDNALAVKLRELLESGAENIAAVRNEVQALAGEGRNEAVFNRIRDEVITDIDDVINYDRVIHDPAVDAHDVPRPNFENTYIDIPEVGELAPPVPDNFRVPGEGEELGA